MQYKNNNSSFQNHASIGEINDLLIIVDLIISHNSIKKSLRHNIPVCVCVCFGGNIPKWEEERW